MKNLILIFTTFYSMAVLASEPVHEQPDLPITVVIRGNQIEFLGVKGSDQKTTVPVYSKNCEADDCKAIKVARKSTRQMLTPGELQNGEDPAYLFCEKTGGKLVSGMVEGKKRSQLFCEFISKKQFSYIDPAILWMIANNQL